MLHRLFATSALGVQVVIMKTNRRQGGGAPAPMWARCRCSPEISAQAGGMEDALHRRRTRHGRRDRCHRQTWRPCQTRSLRCWVDELLTGTCADGLACASRSVAWVIERQGVQLQGREG